MRRPVPVLATLYVALLSSAALHGAGSCGVTTYTPHPPASAHQALYITDPVGQQTAVFDLTWGGALASLKYNGVETVWGYATGAMVQPAWFGTYNSSNNQFYNPTQAGDIHDNGSPVLEAACNPTPVALIISGVTDYAAGESGYATGNTVWSGNLRTSQYATPYTVTTTATFVQNPLGTPAYYLKLDQTIHNVHQTENQNFSFSLAGYSLYANSFYANYPANCTFKSSNCPAATTSAIAAGMYPTGSLASGLAIATSPSKYFASSASAFFSCAPDNINQDQSCDLWAYTVNIPPGTSKHYVWYVMVGGWSSAQHFAQTNQ